MSNYNWDGKRVAVTGGAGFVGSHLVDDLVRRGATVRVLDDFSRGTNKNPDAEYIVADANDEDVCEEVFSDCEVVFNLAASVAGVEYNSEHGQAMFESNVGLQSAPVSGAIRAYVTNGIVDTFVQISSACVYDPARNHPALDTIPLLGNPHKSNRGYATAKRIGEGCARVASDYINKVVVIRPSNIYGSRDYYDDRAHVIPSLIKQYLNTGTARIVGDGSAIREFLYVKDAASAMIHLAEVARSGCSMYNIGTNGETKTSILDLHRLIRKEIGITDELPEPSQRIEDAELARWSDCTKLFDTGWRYEYDLSRGIYETVREAAIGFSKVN